MRKQNERPRTTFNRRRSRYAPYDLVLIVCEGAKTEPVYFSSLRNELHLSHANIRICGKECGSAPISVVDYAIEEFRKSGDYNRVYCVFDKDRHETYEAALDKVRRTRLRGGAQLIAITSIPCFEYWLLLHFVETARPYGGSASSPCEELLRDLKVHISDYEKGKDVFRVTYPRVEDALRWAEQREKNCLTGGTDNPSTKVHQLVSYMRNIKKSDE